MSGPYLSLVFLLYGLAFFSMGLVVTLERGRGTDERLRHALRPLAVFGLAHGIHEWLEMFSILGFLPAQEMLAPLWEGLRLSLLVLSFLSLAAFGASLLSPNANLRRVSLLLPLAQAAIWVFGVMIMRGYYPAGRELWDVVDVWSRYVVGIPAALVASLGLVAQQRAFRQAGLARFGRDTLWAAVAFIWYGLVGQLFTRSSPFFISSVINQDIFLHLFGFPVQILRAIAAWIATLFIIRSLRSFEVETQQKIAELQEARLQESQRREALRGKLLSRIVAAQEAERQRIARELHDETGQALTAIGLGIRGATAILDQDVGKATHNLQQLEGLTARSLDELQRLIADLRPSHLDDLGLPAALRWYANETQNRGSVTVTMNIKGEERPLSPLVKTALFRIVQEALTNVIKHAEATMAQATLSYFEEMAGVEVLDNGRGFNVDHVTANEGRPSWGLLGMEERATLLGGHFLLESHPGKGTRVYVTIPYQPEPVYLTSEENHDNAIAAS